MTDMGDHSTWGFYTELTTFSRVLTNKPDEITLAWNSRVYILKQYIRVYRPHFLQVIVEIDF